MGDFKAYVESYEEEYINDLARLVACRSVRNTDHRTAGSPLGPGIRKAFDVFLELAASFGLESEDFDGYACHACLEGEDSREYIGIVGHLDVVEPGNPALWRTDPFSLNKEGGQLVGRGVNDDKGPLLACLYALRIIKERGLPLVKQVRVIAGGAEETTWECMEHYFSRNPQPVMGFSPDGNFPVVNGEKGIIKYDLLFQSGSAQGTGGRIKLLSVSCDSTENFVCSLVSVRTQEDGRICKREWTGRRALSRNPQRGENALWKMARFYRTLPFIQDEANQLVQFLNERLCGDYYGENLGIASIDAEMGSTSVCPTGIVSSHEGLHLYVDIRYPKTVNPGELTAHIRELGIQYGYEVRTAQEKRLLYVPQESALVRSLKDAYHAVTGEPARAITKGGASYARVLDCGVAFGASFEGEDARPHMPGERMSIVSLKKAMEIYCEAIYRLAR